MWCEIVPCNEENLASLKILCCCEIIIIDCITTLIGRQTGGEILITFIRLPELLHHHLLLLNLEHNETVAPLCFQLQEPQLAIILHSHSWCRICLHNSFTHTIFLYYRNRKLLLLQLLHSEFIRDGTRNLILKSKGVGTALKLFWRDLRGAMAALSIRPPFGFVSLTRIILIVKHLMKLI